MRQHEISDPFEETHFVKYHIWYRLWRWRRFGYTSSSYIQLPCRFLINTERAGLTDIIQDLESQIGSQPSLQVRVKTLRFYSRWLDPVIVPLLQFFLRLRGSECTRVLDFSPKSKNRNL